MERKKAYDLKLLRGGVLGLVLALTLVGQQRTGLESNQHWSIREKLLSHRYLIKLLCQICQIIGCRLGFNPLHPLLTPPPPGTYWFMPLLLKL